MQGSSDECGGLLRFFGGRGDTFEFLGDEFLFPWNFDSYFWFLLSERLGISLGGEGRFGGGEGCFCC